MAVSCVLALGASLALTSCGNQAPDAAAIVDGTVIKDKDIQTVAREFQTLQTGEQKVGPRDVLIGLILAPYVTAEANRTGRSIPDADLLKVVAKVPDRSVALVDFVRTVLAYKALDPTSRAKVTDELVKAKVTVNPRYGSYDAKQNAFLATSPNWIKVGAAPVAK